VLVPKDGVLSSTVAFAKPPVTSSTTAFSFGNPYWNTIKYFLPGVSIYLIALLLVSTNPAGSVLTNVPVGVYSEGLIEFPFTKKFDDPSPFGYATVFVRLLLALHKLFVALK
jgi:hypothetical protein